MYDPNISVLREAFLSRILEQFRKLAGDIVAPYRAEAWTVRDEALNKAVLRVSREGKGEEDEVLGVVACFDDAGAKLAGWRERFSLLWEWKDEVSEVLGLGWKSSAPDAQAGLDLIGVSLGARNRFPIWSAPSGVSRQRT